MGESGRLDRERLLAWPFEEVEQRYEARDVMLYALGLGLGQDATDPGHLAFVYEKDVRVVPTFPVVLCHPGPWSADPRTGIVRGQLLHGEQEVVLHRPLPTAATVRGRTRIVDVVDKGEGRGALIYLERVLVDAEDGSPLATLRSVSFCRANGGFGGPAAARRPTPLAPLLARAPDLSVTLPIASNAALLYRLNADFNPLHADPEVAARAGFERPILHGLCTLGMACRAVLTGLCGGDPDRVRQLAVRFSAAIYPGETLVVDLWRTDDGAAFRARCLERGVTVLDRGRAVLGPPSGVGAAAGAIPDSLSQGDAR